MSEKSILLFPIGTTSRVTWLLFFYNDPVKNLDVLDEK